MEINYGGTEILCAGFVPPHEQAMPVRIAATTFRPATPCEASSISGVASGSLLVDPGLDRAVINWR
jgi:hypothetical protein